MSEKTVKPTKPAKDENHSKNDAHAKNEAHSEAESHSKIETLAEKAEKLDKVIKKRQPAIIREFSEFINRGNVVDLAVGVIIGGAFGKIVTSLVNDIIMPLVGTLMGGIDFSHLEITVPNFINQEGGASHITYGNFIQNVIDFLIVAFCIFLFVRFINKLSAKKKKSDEGEASKKPAKKSTDEEILEVLKDIKSSLKK